MNYYQLFEHDREIDSHHYTNPIIWHGDGRIYSRRGGDYGAAWLAARDLLRAQGFPPSVYGAFVLGGAASG